jgi:hypothetical protein
MAFPNSGSFDYWHGGRPLASTAKTTGDFDYWVGGRPIAMGTSTPAAASSESGLASLSRLGRRRRGSVVLAFVLGVFYG